MLPRPPISTLFPYTTLFRSYVLCVGAVAGLAVYMKNRNHYFNTFHLVAVFCLLSALVSALVSDRKSTRLNSSHVRISYAVFCLKKKNFIDQITAATSTSG